MAEHQEPAAEMTAREKPIPASQSHFGSALSSAPKAAATRLYDCFVAVPGAGWQGEVAEMDEVDVDFDADSSQVFHVGPASVAVPGTTLGLEAVHRKWGSVPWAELAAPAAALAREGV